MKRFVEAITIMLLVSFLCPSVAPVGAVGICPAGDAQIRASITAEGDVAGTMDLRAVPRPPDGVITEWKAGPQSTTIVYKYPSSVHSPEEIVAFYADALPELGWVWESRGGKTLEQSMAQCKLYYNYTGPQPLYTLRLEVRQDATVRLYVTHAKRAAEDFSLFEGNPLQLGEDMPGAYDLKAIPRPPDSVITNWKASQGNVTIDYRYDWEKHGMDDIVNFYVQTLPAMGWMWTSRGGKTLEQSVAERKLYYDYAGSHPLFTLQFEVRKDRSVHIYTTHAKRELEDLCLFSGHPLELGNDMPGTYDLKAIPRPPDSVITNWKASSGITTVDYRYDWGKYSMDDIVYFYVQVLPELGWVWQSKGGKTLEQSMAERKLDYTYEGPMALKTLRVEVRKDRTVHVYVAHGKRDLDDFDLFSLDGAVVIDFSQQTDVDLDQTISIMINQELQITGGPFFGDGIVVTPPPTPPPGVPFHHVKIINQVCSPGAMYFILRLEKLPDYPPMDYIGVEISLLNQDSHLAQVVPVLDWAPATQMILEPLSLQVFGENDQMLIDTESLTGTVANTATGIYEVLAQPTEQPRVKVRLGWESPQVAGERLDFLVHVRGVEGKPFGAMVAVMADPAGVLPAVSSQVSVACEP